MIGRAAYAAANALTVWSIQAGVPRPPYTRRNAIVIETVGRTSGRRRRVPVGYLEDGGTLVVVVEDGLRAHWVRNALASGGRLRIHFRGSWRAARLRIVDRDPEASLARMNRVHAALVRRHSTTPAVVEITPGGRPHQPGTLNRGLRGFVRWIYNPLAMTVAGRAHSPYAVVHHVGRRTGRSYATPVVAHATADGFLIVLPYGADVEWCRNVLAAGRCTMRRGGVEHHLVAPEVVDAERALPELPAWLPSVFRLFALDLRTLPYLRLRSAAR